MPYWLRKQLKRAFQGKDRRQIRILNDCWFQYQERNTGETHPMVYTLNEDHP